MQLEAQADNLRASGTPAESATVDLTNLIAGDFNSPGAMRPHEIGSSLFGRLLEALPIPALVIQSTGLTAFANRACGKISNQYKQILGKPFSDLFSQSECRVRAVSLLKDVFQTGKPHTHEAAVEIMGGRPVWGRMSLRSIKLGSDRVALVLVEDLTNEKAQLKIERKLNEQLCQEISRRQTIEKALRESQEKLTLAIKGADVSLWDWNIATDSLFGDDRLSEILGYQPGEIRERRGSWGQLMPAEDSRLFDKSIQDLKAGLCESFDIEHRLRTKSGDWRWVLTRGKVVARDEQGNAVRALGTILDITEHKKDQEQVRALTHALIKAQENERRNLALDLHDEVAQQISVLRVLLEPVREEVTHSQPELGRKIAGISRQIQQLVELVRSMSYELRPPGLDGLGLVSTIGQYCLEFSRKNGIKVNFFPKGMDNLKFDFETEINLFRLMQESLSNVRKHATATTVTVKLEAVHPNIALSIEDDGRGFDVQQEIEKSCTAKKMGLWSMEQRVSLLCGKIAIHSGLDRGTRIFIEVPWRGVTNE